MKPLPPVNAYIHPYAPRDVYVVRGPGQWSTYLLPRGPAIADCRERVLFGTRGAGGLAKPEKMIWAPLPEAPGRGKY